MATKRKDRTFYDHGILSACILLFVQEAICEYLDNCEKVIENVCDNLDTTKRELMMYEDQLDLLKQFLQARTKYKDYAHTAAKAIAVHNVRKKMDSSDMDELNRKGVTIGELQIRLENEPIIYLLRLCDELQRWDRKGFSAPDKSASEKYVPGGEKFGFDLSKEKLALWIDEGMRKKLLEDVDGIFYPAAKDLLNI